MELPPLLVLVLGTVIVIGGIVGLRVGAFISLIVAAIVVSLLAPGADKIGRVAAAFGSMAGNIGIVIALAAVIGKCLMDSGAADRIVRAFLSMLGEKRAPTALMGSGFVLAIPVFFDTVFYLLVPLARSMYRRLGRNYLFFILAISAGGAITHTLVPPTPGPLLMAEYLSVDLGMMIMVGTLIALPTACVGLIFAGICNKKMPIEPMDSGDEVPAFHEDKLPPLGLSVLPVLLPVLLISTNTVLTTIADGEHSALLKTEDIRDWDAFRKGFQADLDPARERIWSELPSETAVLLKSVEPISDDLKKSLTDGLNLMLGKREFYDEEAFLGVRLGDATKGLLGGDLLRMPKANVERMNRLLLEDLYPGDQLERHVWKTAWRNRADMSKLFGNANFALLLSAIIALLLYVKQRKPSRREFGLSVETALMSGGLIILITSAGGAFGGMLQAAQIGPAIQEMFTGDTGKAMAGIMLLALGFFIASLLKVAQGSSTVAMITASAILADMITPDSLGFHPVYLATAIGAGSLVGSWMNDSGFWIFAKMGGLTEVEALKSWLPLLAIMGVVAFIVTVVMSLILPMAG